MSFLLQVKQQHAEDNSENGSCIPVSDECSICQNTNTTWQMLDKTVSNWDQSVIHMGEKTRTISQS